MKKWLIRCLTVLAMVCLIPGIALNAKAAEETVPVFCARCETMNEREVLRYEKYDSTCHRVYVTECPNCHNDGDIPYIMFHTGGTQGPTCTKGKICEKCGAEYAIPGHVWGEWSSAGNGTHIRNCKNCYKVDTASCTGGTATCSAKAVCEACGVEYGEKDLNNHDLVQHEAKAPTCTEIGWNAYETCSRCDHTTYTELPALNHDLEQRAAKAPTCTETGWDAYEGCTRSGCNYTTYHVRPALKHNLVRHVAKAPTCTEIGWDAYETCSRCNHTTYAELPALNHDLEQHEAKAPTCTEIGWDAYETCSRCDHTTYTELPALNHALEQHEAQAPTCTEIGWDAYETCSRCDYTTYVEIPASGHALTRREAKAATCTEIGWDAYDTCSNCDYTTYVEIPASGHALTHHEAKTATCTEIGWDAYDTCSNCDYTTTHTETPASGHVLTNYGENWGLVFCPVCGKVENGERLELLETASAAAVDGKLPEGELVARMNQRYLSLAFVHEGKLTAPAGRVKITLPAEIVQGKRLLLIAPDGTETELPFEIVGETISFTLDFTEVENPAVLVLKPL